MKIHGFPQITPLVWLRFCTWQTRNANSPIEHQIFYALKDVRELSHNFDYQIYQNKLKMLYLYF